VSDRSETCEGRRILICAPFGRDADAVSSILTHKGYEAVICRDLEDVAGLMSEQIGAILLTEEALARNADTLKSALQAQPSWSDVPFVLLAAPRAARMPSARLSQLALFDLSSNSVVLERPLGSASLFSAIASAMRLRQKQFQMRDRLRDLDESETRLRLATSAAGIGTWDYNPATGALRWDERCRAMFGLTSDRQISYEGTFLAGLHPQDKERADNAVKAALEPTGRGEFEVEYRTIGIDDGKERWIAAKGGAIFSGASAVRFIGTVIDITERKRTESALAASEAALRVEREALDTLNRTLEQRVAERTAALENEMAARNLAEEALRQSQKMEAVGQLTGGIAHDFNNMLTGIIGGINIAKRRIASGRLEDVDRFMDAAVDSANRAAALIARLLAFSRRQTLDSKPVEIAPQLEATRELLERTLPENIRVEIDVEAGTGAALADVNQLESALLNLAVNARDAMPDGGRLRVAARRCVVEACERSLDLKPGTYVLLAVSDTGIGMPADVVNKVFEPFFTTKPIGQGTGLGLSMIYGFVRQSGGQVRIDSRPGQGTTIELYLPAADGPSDDKGPMVPEAAPEGRGQSVLVVEDDDAVRLLICDVLGELSYLAFEAANAEAAIGILASEKTVDLMVSDVGLPGMNGRQLAEIARQYRPDLPILFVTGYAENAATKASFLGPNMAMIGKPFAVDDLAAKINEMMLANNPGR
jgi:PAS domain S-box-containing protein